MHPEARAFVRSIVRTVGSPIDALEIGSRDVNGNCRDFFPSVESWYGIDLREGPNVDEVTDAETYVPFQTYDLVLCTEVLEHAKRPDKIVALAYEALTDSGCFVMTCAGVGRRPHDNNGAHPAVMTEHYSNISQPQMDEWLIDAGFRWRMLESNNVSKDLYALARR